MIAIMRGPSKTGVATKAFGLAKRRVIRLEIGHSVVVHVLRIAQAQHESRHLARRIGTVDAGWCPERRTVRD